VEGAGNYADKASPEYVTDVWMYPRQLIILFLEQSKNKGAEAIAAILTLENVLEQHRSMVHELENSILSGTANIVDIDVELLEYRGKCKRVADNIQKRRNSLGVSDQANLRDLRNSAYLRIRMNARAIKTRLRDRLRNRKFEIEKLERSYRRTVNGKCPYYVRA
jgi:hypothetical protein